MKDLGLERIFEVIPWVAGLGFWRSLNIELLVYIKRREVLFSFVKENKEAAKSTDLES